VRAKQARMSCQRLLSHSLHTAACCSGQGQRHCFTNSLLHIITRALILHRNDACLTQIPTAKNIPLGEVQKAVALTPTEFEAKYGFRKPTKDNLVVVYCRAGVRSEQVRTLHTLQSLPLNCVLFSVRFIAVAVVRASQACSSRVSQQMATQQHKYNYQVSVHQDTTSLAVQHVSGQWLVVQHVSGQWLVVQHVSG
jgi:hypothetical protein